ncbi:hypothetical protein P3S67_007104 [Capsicum chacoense]
MQYDRHLLTTMVERWRPKSHCFHLLFGEATITLQDVQVLFGLRVDGHPIYLGGVFGRGRSWHDILEALRGYVGPINGRSFVSLTNLIDFIKDELEIEPIGYDTPVARVEKIVQLYMLVILGGILFLNSSSILIRLHFCAFLYPLALLVAIFGAVQYWPTYTGHCVARHIKVWCWERMLPLHPGLYQPEDNDAALPYATRWTRGVERNIKSHHTLIAIRDQIDHMTEVQEYYRAGFVPSAGSLAALSRGLRKIFKILKEVQKDPAHALWGHEIKSVVKQTFEEARDVIPSYGGRGHGHPRGRPCNELSPSTPVVPSEAIPDMSGPYSMRPMELPSRPADGRPMRDVEAVRLSYESAIGDGYISEMTGPSDLIVCLFLPPFAKPERYARLIYSPHGSIRPPNDMQFLHYFLRGHAWFGKLECYDDGIA